MEDSVEQTINCQVYRDGACGVLILETVLFFLCAF